MSLSDSDKTANGSSLDSTLADLNAWLDDPEPPAGADNLEDIRNRLRALGPLNPATPQLAPVWGKIYARGISAVETRLPALTETPLPIPGKVRLIVRDMQEVLHILAQNLQTLAEMNCDAPTESSNETSALALWRALHALSRHLLISSLTASPPGTDIWRQLHRAYNLARQFGVTRTVPDGVPRSLQDEYYAAVLLGCAQPTSFTGAEVCFLDGYLERFSGQIDSNKDKPAESPVMFWIDPTRDAPATPCTRKPPPPETPVRYFSCSRLAHLLAEQLAALESGMLPEQLDIPPFAATPAGRGVLYRLINFWGKPGKRRFPRRRQNYRGELCFGFGNLCLLYGKKPQPVETSVWMITNESPDGYSAMHVSGKTGAITVGDVVALRTETGKNWQLCITRWALSENPEHLELGLQILSVRAYTVDIALPTEAKANACRPALLLPAAPALLQEEALVVPSGTLAERSRNLVLVIERDNIEVREVTTAKRDEQNGLIELYEIEPQSPED